MNEMVNLIPTCTVSSKKKKYSRMILLNSEKQCTYVYTCIEGGRAEEEDDGRKGDEKEEGGREGGGGERDEV